MATETALAAVKRDPKLRPELTGVKSAYFTMYAGDWDALVCC